MTGRRYLEATAWQGVVAADLEAVVDGANEVQEGIAHLQVEPREPPGVVVTGLFVLVDLKRDLCSLGGKPHPILQEEGGVL